MEKAERGFAGTGAPLVVKDKLIVGIAGGEFANRGFHRRVRSDDRAASLALVHDSGPGRTGQRDVAGAICSQRGGGPTWLTGTYDPRSTSLLGHGQSEPRLGRRTRPGDNLYTGSLVALDPDTGTMKWHYQFTPHDTHDWDANEVPVLADITLDGRTAQSCDDGQPERLLLRARSRDGEPARRQAVRQHDVGERNREGRTSSAPARTRADRRRHRDVPRIGTAARTSCRPPTTRRADCSSSACAKRARSSSGARRRPIDVGDLTLGGTVAPVSRIQGVGSAARARPGDRDEEVGDSLRRRGLGRRARDRRRRRLQRRPRRAISSPPIRSPARSCSITRPARRSSRRRRPT